MRSVSRVVVLPVLTSNIMPCEHSVTTASALLPKPHDGMYWIVTSISCLQYVNQ
jgi:hypothetical protein